MLLGSHGLGNSRANAIPLCQLQQIKNYLADLDETYNLGVRTSNNGSYAFWLDTLCIPVDPSLKEYRKKAISLMAHTYSEATAVLVLDRELNQTNSKTAVPLQQSLELLFSGWMRRLWTLQEASLAREVFVMMKDGPTRLSRSKDSRVLIANKLKREEHTKAPTNMGRLLSDILLQSELDLLIQRRLPLAQHFQRAGSYHTSYQFLCSAVEARNTSKLADEPIILASIMGCNVTEMLQQPEERRMSFFHELVGKIPADIIYLENQIQRLAYSPFRWAPKSLMANEIARQTTDGVGICSSSGLHLESAAFIIEEGQESSASSSGDQWYLREHDSGRVHEVHHNMDKKLPSRCAILFNLDRHGFGAVAEVVDNSGDGSITPSVTVVGLVQFLSKTGLKPGETVITGREILECRRASPTRRWLVT